MKPTIKVENWYVIDDTLHGFVIDHPKSVHRESSITSSKITKYDYSNQRVETKNTVYILGKAGHPFLKDPATED